MKINFLFYFFLLMFLIPGNIFSQIVIVDSEYDKPIPAASVYINGGKLGAISDIDGKIPVDFFYKTDNDNADISIQHIGYKNVNMSLSELKKSTIVKMQRLSTVLPDISVRSLKNYDYIVLKGFFRTYQSFDGTPKYFSDGMANYYIPLKKGKVLKEPLQYRVFANKELVRKLEHKSINLFSEPPRMPAMYKETALKDLNSKKYIVKEAVGGKNIIKSDSVIGFVRYNDSNALVFIDKLAPEKERTFNLLGVEMKELKNQVTEIYSRRENANEFQKKNLKSVKQNSVLQYKRKKAKEFYEIEFISELYIIERSFISKKDLKKNIGSGIYLKEIHHYETEYWKDIEKYNIPLLNHTIEKELGTTLILY